MMPSCNRRVPGAISAFLALGLAAVSPASAQVSWTSTPVNICPAGDASKLDVSGLAAGDTVVALFDLSSCGSQVCAPLADANDIVRYEVISTGASVQIAPVVGGVGCCMVKTEVYVNSAFADSLTNQWRSFDLSSDGATLGGDCFVDSSTTSGDAGYFQSLFLSSSCEGDYSNNGTVDLVDLSIFTTHVLHDGVLNVPAEYNDINTAIAAATSGDIILVADGTYSGAGNCGIDFGGLDLFLLSENGSSVTTLDCLEGDRNLWFHSGETSASLVKGFTFTGGDSTIGGSSIRIGPGASSPRIQECVITGNAAQFPDSGVVLVEAGAPSFDLVEITNNTAPDGIVIVTGGTPAFNDCDISGNTGRGVVVDPVGAAFTGTSFSANVGAASTSGERHPRPHPSAPTRVSRARRSPGASSRGTRPPLPAAGS